MQGVVDFGTGHAMRGTYGIKSDMGGKTGTTNDNTDGWFIGYTPQLLAGAWVGCDDPFLHIRNGWTNGGNDMAMPEWAFFMQKVYADKKLGSIQKHNFKNLQSLIMILFMPIRILLQLFKKVKAMILPKTRVMAMPEIIVMPRTMCLLNQNLIKNN